MLGSLQKQLQTNNADIVKNYAIAGLEAPDETVRTAEGAAATRMARRMALRV